MMPKSPAERKAAQRARQAAAGGKKLELALRKRKGRTMPRHDFSQMVNGLRDVPSVQSKREKIVRVLHAFNINPEQPE